MRFDPAHRGVVAGITGSGKSFGVKRRCAQLMEAGVRLVVADVCDEYSRAGKQTKSTSLGPLTQRCTIDELAADPRRYLDRSDLALAVVLDRELPATAARDFEFLCLILQHTGGLHFVVEEVGFLREGGAEPRLSTIATMWRHEDIAVDFISQRVVHVPPSARSQAREAWLYQQTEPSDLAAAEERCREIPDLAERLPRLARGECIHWRAGVPTK